MGDKVIIAGSSQQFVVTGHSNQNIVAGGTIDNFARAEGREEIISVCAVGQPHCVKIRNRAGSLESHRRTAAVRQVLEQKGSVTKGNAFDRIQQVSAAITRDLNNAAEAEIL